MLKCSKCGKERKIEFYVEMVKNEEICGPKEGRAGICRECAVKLARELGKEIRR